MLSPWAKYTYSGILFFNHMALGLCLTAIGPVLTELVDILQTTTESLTLFTTFTSTGFVLGSLFCFSLKYLNRQLVWVFWLVVMAVSIACVPHSPNKGALYGCALGIGMGSGVLNSIINAWLTEMWREKSPPILQIPGFTFGIGTLLSPLIIKPFLADRHLVANGNGTNSSGTHWVYDMHYEEDRRSKLTIPFSILGGIQLLFPVLMFIMFIVRRYTYDPNEVTGDLVKSDDNENKLFDRQRQSRWLVIILMSVLCGVFNVYESMIYTFAVTYFQYGSLQLDAAEASVVITGFTATYAGFRGLSCFIAVKVLPKYMLSVHYAISVVGVVLLATANSLTMLWVANVVLGIGCSAIMQTTYAFIGQHIRMTDTINTILVVFFGSINVAPPYVLGLFVKDHSFVFILVESCAIGVCIGLFTIIMLIIRKYQRLDHANKPINS